MILELILDPQVPLPPCLCSQGGDIKPNEITSEEVDGETKAADSSSLGSTEINAQMIDQLPQMEPIGKFMFVYKLLFFRLLNSRLLKKGFVKGSSLLSYYYYRMEWQTFE